MPNLVFRTRNLNEVIFLNMQIKFRTELTFHFTNKLNASCVALRRIICLLCQFLKVLSDANRYLNRIQQVSNTTLKTEVKTEVR